MIEKEVIFFGRTEAGIFAQALFPTRMEKTAAQVVDSWDTAPDIRKFIKTLKSEDRERNAYVLVNALGAGEFFGPNINSDYFPWDALAHEGDDYGYKTFYNAHAFQHHANKDPARAFGIPVLSVLHPRMKRVELIIKLDRSKARELGADGIITRIDNGEFPDVSMGCKVPYDICSICGHRSKTRNDYCQHMRPPEELRHIYGPNKILPDGRKIYVINTLPRFFDISFVFIGADKTAKVMAKLASKGSHVCLGSVCALPSAAEAAGPALYGPSGDVLDVGQLRKTASACDDRTGPCGRRCAECADRDRCEGEKLASAFRVKSAGKKIAEIVKDVPTGVFSMKRLPQMEKAEPDISREDLDRLAERPLSSALGAAARLGIVLKPHEFQRVVLKRMGEDAMISHLDKHHHVFREVPDVGSDLSCDLRDPLDEVFDLLKKYIRARTALGPSFQMRVMVVGKAKNVLPTRSPIGNSLLDKVSAAYNSYRRDVLEKVSQVVHEVQSDPRLTEEILGDGLSMMFKTASSGILFPDSVKYMLGAHLQDRGLLCNSVAGAAVPDDSVFSETIPA